MERRIGLTAADLKHPVANEFLDFLDNIVQDGAITKEEIISLRDWLVKNKDYEIPAVTFLWEKLKEVASDGKIDKDDTKILFDAILLVLPSKNRKVAKEARKEFELEQKEIQKIKEDTEKAKRSAELRVKSDQEKDVEDCEDEPEIRFQGKPSTTFVEHLDFLVAGTNYHPGHKNVVSGERVCFVRDPDNKFDSNAIRILTVDKVMIGHVPAFLAEKIAPLLDRGYLDESYIKRILYNDVPVVVSKVYLENIPDSQSPIGKISETKKFRFFRIMGFVLRMILKWSYWLIKLALKQIWKSIMWLYGFLERKFKHR
jgi:hypothetical protein